MARDPEVDLVKQRVSLADVVREVVGELKPRGEDLWGCCPFHHEDTPSFHVRPRLGMYKCFGCGEGGDVLAFVMKTRGLPFREALELLAQRAGLELNSLTPEQRRQAEQARRSRDVLEAALQHFRRALALRGNPALKYMRERGFTDETLAAFDIGFIPQDFLTELRATRQDPLAVDGAGFTSLFGGRVSFGIRDGNGGLVGFGARRLLDDAAQGAKAKYVNTRETPWFTKGRLLYGLDKASRRVSRTRRLVVMEGYTDVMMAHQRGVDEAVATMGTAFTAEHLRLVRARVGDLVLVFDSDDAGRTAAERTVRMVLAEGLECRVVHVPEGKDPCDWFSTRGREDFDALLATTGCSGVELLCRRGLERTDPRQPGGREQVAREVLELTRTVQDPIRRETLVGDVSRACGLDRTLVQRVALGAAVRRRPEAGPVTLDVPGALNAQVRAQLIAVAGLVEDPRRLAALRELAAEGGLPHAMAATLLELAENLLAGDPGLLDAAAWLEAAGQRDPALRARLERVLFPLPGAPRWGWEESLDYLRRAARDEADKAHRREALGRADLASNEAELRALQERLRRRSARGSVMTPEPPA
jgi:DNA primase catalytic core